MQPMRMRRWVGRSCRWFFPLALPLQNEEKYAFKILYKGNTNICRNLAQSLPSILTSLRSRYGALLTLFRLEEDRERSGLPPRHAGPPGVFSSPEQMHDAVSIDMYTSVFCKRRKTGENKCRRTMMEKRTNPVFISFTFRLSKGTNRRSMV